MLILDTYPDLKPSLKSSLANLLINIYPILVQIRIRKKLLNILKSRNKDTIIEDENIIQDEKDIDKIKELIEKI